MPASAVAASAAKLSAPSRSLVHQELQVRFRSAGLARRALPRVGFGSGTGPRRRFPHEKALLRRGAAQAPRPIKSHTLLGYIGRPHYAVSPVGSEKVAPPINLRSVAGDRRPHSSARTAWPAQVATSLGVSSGALVMSAPALTKKLKATASQPALSVRPRRTAHASLLVIAERSLDCRPCCPCAPGSTKAATHRLKMEPSTPAARPPTFGPTLKDARQGPVPVPFPFPVPVPINRERRAPIPGNAFAADACLPWATNAFCGSNGRPTRATCTSLGSWCSRCRSARCRPQAPTSVGFTRPCCSSAKPSLPYPGQ